MRLSNILPLACTDPKATDSLIGLNCEMCSVMEYRSILWAMAAATMSLMSARMMWLWLSTLAASEDGANFSRVPNRFQIGCAADR